MSVIVVVKKGGQIAMAADTAQTADNMLMDARFVKSHSKILTCNDAFLGLAGWLASQDMLENIVHHHAKDLNFSNRHEIFETALFIHKQLKEHYFLDSQEDKEQPVESSQLGMLIAHPNGIFELESYRAVTEFTQYWALGSGKHIALGALHALYPTERDALSIAEAAVTAAATFDDGCALPLEAHSLAVTPT